MNKSDEELIFIRNPKIIDLGPEVQADEISKFIIGLLHFNAGRFNQTQTCMSSAITNATNSTRNAKKFVGQCQLYLGGSYVKQRQFDKAQAEYEKGLKAD